MKDSVGSTVLMKIFVVFMVVYIILMASILNYTKTFRIKNQVVNIINRHGGYTALADSEIIDYISKSSIYGKCNLLEGNNEFGSNKEDKCEIKQYQMTDAAGGSYYKVRVYVTFQFPLIKQTLQIPITGETKRLYGAPSTPNNGPQYDIVNKSYNPTNDKADLEIAEDACLPGTSSPPAASGCCNRAICGGGEYRYTGVCACYSRTTGEKTGETTYNSSLPGRRRSANGCYYCYDCDSKAVLDTVTGEGGSPNDRSESRRVVVSIADPGYVGMGDCTSTVGGSKSGNSFVITASNKCIDKGTISCTDMLGNKSTKTVSLYTKAANCDTCNSNGTCGKCEDGYYNANGKCEQCSSICATCSGSNSLCITCAAGYAKSGSTCRPCTETLQYCAECESTTKCTKCSGNYIVENGKCVLKEGNCYKCSYYGGHSYKWSESGSPGSNCTLVDIPKASCSGNTNCGNISNCSACTQNKKGYCTLCNTGYTLSSGNCSKISCSSMTGCDLCRKNSTGNCITCKSNYYSSGGNCYKCPAGCSTCTSSTKCTACIDAYYKSNGLCYQCPTGCTACTSTSYCSSCSSGYYMAGILCKKCDTGCTACAGPSNCSKCATGYKLNGKVCEKDTTCNPSRPLCKPRTVQPSCDYTACKCTCPSNGGPIPLY